MPSNSTHSTLLARIARLCMIARSRFGIKIDAVRIVGDPEYAASIFEKIKTQQGVEQELLDLCDGLAAEIGQSPRQAAGNRESASNPKVGGTPKQVAESVPPPPPSKSPNENKPEPDKKPTDTKKDLKFGPRG